MSFNLSTQILLRVTQKLLRESVTLKIILGIELWTFPEHLLQFLRCPTKLNGVRNREKVYCHVFKPQLVPHLRTAFSLFG